MIRFSRTPKEQYVLTEDDGKATGWKAFYKGGNWVEEQARSRATAKRAKK